MLSKAETDREIIYEQSSVRISKANVIKWLRISAQQHTVKHL